MRKFLTALLAVLMLVSIALPAFAAEPVTAADGTTPDDADALSLVVTEYLSDSTANDVGMFESTSDTGEKTQIDSKTYNAYQYIEIYNNGNESVDLYNLAVAVSSDAKDAQGKRYWSDLHVFQEKMSLQRGSIYTGITLASGAATPTAQNPQNAVLEPGKFAVIWFWNDSTTTIASKMTTSPGAEVGGIYHKGFRDHYGMDAETLVVAVYAGADSVGSDKQEPGAGGTRFRLNVNGAPFTYALINENGLGNKGWDLGTAAWSAESGYHASVLSLFTWGTSSNIGINPYEGKSTAYVPANCTPDLYNANEKASLDEGESFTPATDYYEIEYVDSYKEMAVVHFEQDPTPGKMPDWQWAYVAPNSEYVAGKLNGKTLEAWSTDVITTFVEGAVNKMDNVAGSEEEKIEIVFKDRSELGNMGQNQQQTNTNNNTNNTSNQEKGLSPLVLALIIGGGVLLLAAIAFVLVLVLVILPKKKKAAAALSEAEVAAVEAAEAAAAEESKEE